MQVFLTSSVATAGIWPPAAYRLSRPERVHSSTGSPDAVSRSVLPEMTHFQHGARSLRSLWRGHGVAVSPTAPKNSPAMPPARLRGLLDVLEGAQRPPPCYKAVDVTKSGLAADPIGLPCVPSRQHAVSHAHQTPPPVTAGAACRNPAGPRPNEIALRRLRGNASRKAADGAPRPSDPRTRAGDKCEPRAIMRKVAAHNQTRSAGRNAA